MKNLGEQNIVFKLHKMIEKSKKIEHISFIYYFFFIIFLYFPFLLDCFNKFSYSWLGCQWPWLTLQCLFFAFAFCFFPCFLKKILLLFIIFIYFYFLQNNVFVCILCCCRVFFLPFLNGCSQRFYSFKKRVCLMIFSMFDSKSIFHVEKKRVNVQWSS